MFRLRDRSTGELLVLMIAGTVCSAVGVGGLAAVIYVFLNPGAEILNIARLIAGVINTMIGLLAGFLAGSTSRSLLPKRKEGQCDEADDQEGEQSP